MSIKYTAKRPTFVYLMRLGETDYYKVGISSDLDARMSQLQTATPIELVLINAIEQENAALIEHDIHTALRDNKVRNEWFLCELEEITRIFEDYNAMGIVDSHLGTSTPAPRPSPILLGQKRKRVLVDGIEYPSIQSAADAQGVSRQAMSKRLRRNRRGK